MKELWVDEIQRAMKKMKEGRASNIAEVRVEMLAVAERVGMWWIKRLPSTCMREGNMLEE